MSLVYIWVTYLCITNVSTGLLVQSGSDGHHQYNPPWSMVVHQLTHWLPNVFYYFAFGLNATLFPFKNTPEKIVVFII